VQSWKFGKYQKLSAIYNGSWQLTMDSMYWCWFLGDQRNLQQLLCQMMKMRILMTAAAVQVPVHLGFAFD